MRTPAPTDRATDPEVHWPRTKKTGRLSDPFYLRRWMRGSRSRSGGLERFRALGFDRRNWRSGLQLSDQIEQHVAAVEQLRRGHAHLLARRALLFRRRANLHRRRRVALGRARDQSEIRGGRIDGSRILGRSRRDRRRRGSRSLGRRKDGRERAVQLPAHALDLTHLRHTLLHRLRGRLDSDRYVFGHLDHVVRCRLRLIGELANFSSNDREATSRFACSRRFDRRVEREEIRLLCDPAHRDHELVDLARARVQLANLAGRLLDDRANVEKDLERTIDVDSLGLSLSFDRARQSVHFLRAANEVVATRADTIQCFVHLAQLRDLGLGAV